MSLCSNWLHNYILISVAVFLSVKSGEFRKVYNINEPPQATLFRFTREIRFILLTDPMTSPLFSWQWNITQSWFMLPVTQFEQGNPTVKLETKNNKCLLVCSALIDGWCLESTFSFFRRNKNIKFNHSEICELLLYHIYPMTFGASFTLHYSNKIELHIPISDFYKIGNCVNCPSGKEHKK